MKGLGEMIDFREYKDLIRKAVKTVSENDKNWKWTVRSISKYKVMIRWEYLDYCEEEYPKNCFSLSVDYPDDKHLGDCVTYNRPDGNWISFVSTGPNRWDDARTVEEAIVTAIKRIAGYAHSRY